MDVNPPKIAMISLGCAKNLVSSEQMLFRLREGGCCVQSAPGGADIAVVNTCGFIESAKREAIEKILELAALKREGRLGKILVAGCLAERYKEAILPELPEIDGLVGCGSFHEIMEAVRDVEAGRTSVRFAPPGQTPLGAPRLTATPGYTAYLKVAEGCDNRCAYCVIPALRGPFRSRPMEELLAEAEALTGRGVKELILVAQDTTRYGLDLYGRRRLPELLEALNRLEGLRWLRLHYLYPDEVDDALIGAVARLDKVVKYLDIPIQHCDGKLLRAMNRRGTGAEMETLVSALREAIPGVVLRTSLIVGLPGEDEAAFEALCAFLRRTRWERAGVFAYSAEEGTPAAAMPHQVDETTKQARAETVMALQREIMDEFQDTLRGRILSVLVEGYDRRSGLHVGRSWADSPDVDAEVRFTSRRRLSAGTFARVYVTGARDGDLLGRALGCLKT